MSARTALIRRTCRDLGLGDVANHFQLKHMANAEARVVRDNLQQPGRPQRALFSVVPSALFADPQIASADATEQELQLQKRELHRSYPLLPRCRLRLGA
jgi:pyruvate/2-oxoglutarate dehydrogenase complex dihydrolipoamide dehydrogenase (E3) component